MILKLKDYKIKHLNYISPSQYFSALKCPFKLVLANSFGYQPLLPLNANAHFGSVAHKMIELISKGIISDDQTFSDNWVDLISKKEIELKEKGLGNIIPLKYFVTDFALKKNLIKNVLKKKQEKIPYLQKTFTNKYFPEKRLENFDKSMTGIADLIIENDFGTTILDFKTGRVYSDEIDDNQNSEKIIKKEYEVQLKLYAHLYFLMTGKYPNSLFLVTLLNDFIEVKFNPHDCQNIYMEALNFLSITNSFIDRNDLEAIAIPSQENCKYCSYRPACDFHSKWLKSNFDLSNDLCGTLQRVIKFANGTLGLELKINNNKILINDLSEEFKESFDALIGKNVILYNLKKNKQSYNATANYFTTVYEL